MLSNPAIRLHDMTPLIRSLHITTPREAVHHLKRLDLDATGVRLTEGKAILFNLKMEGVDPRTAAFLKQEMLTVGGEAAVDRKGLDCSVPKTDVILLGTQAQFKTLMTQLDHHPTKRAVAQALETAFDNLFKTHFSLRCRSRTLALGNRTLLMGVLNVTPDSFSDGGRYLSKEQAVAQGMRMVEEGADLVDVGGESTRPGAKPLPLEEELERVLPVVEALSKKAGIPISIDTYKSAVAQRAIEAGAEVINDISGLRFDPHLAEIAAKEVTPIVLMHMQGTPETMQRQVHYDSLFSEILQSLGESIRRAESLGVDPNQVIIDPGIGFGKDLDHNLLILKHLSEFRVLGKPILLGTSRKSFIGKILNADVDHRLEGTLASVVIGACHGAHIIRCHDVLPAKKALAVTDAIRNVEGG